MGVRQGVREVGKDGRIAVNELRDCLGGALGEELELRSRIECAGFGVREAGLKEIDEFSPGNRTVVKGRVRLLIVDILDLGPLRDAVKTASRIRHAFEAPSDPKKCEVGSTVEQEVTEGRRALALVGRELRGRGSPHARSVCARRELRRAMSMMVGTTAGPSGRRSNIRARDKARRGNTVFRGSRLRGGCGDNDGTALELRELCSLCAQGLGAASDGELFVDAAFFLHKLSELRAADGRKGVAFRGKAALS